MGADRTTRWKPYKTRHFKTKSTCHCQESYEHVVTYIYVIQRIPKVIHVKASKRFLTLNVGTKIGEPLVRLCLQRLLLTWISTSFIAVENSMVSDSFSTVCSQLPIFHFKRDQTKWSPLLCVLTVGAVTMIISWNLQLFVRWELTVGSLFCTLMMNEVT